jgi:transposase-like protein
MARNQRDPMFKQRHFDDEIILLCVRWYISYQLSYRDLTEMMLERGLAMAPSTIYRWVQSYVPEFEKRWNRFSRPVGTSWRVDETYVNIKGAWHYLYRAVDKQGRTIDFYLSKTRGVTAAKAFFRKAFATHNEHGPLKVTLDGHQPSHRALRLLRREHATWLRVKVRSCKYLNNIIEQDHRAIKVKCRAMKSVQSFQTANTTITGLELAHRIRKRQFTGLDKDRSRPVNHARAWFAAVMV